MALPRIGLLPDDLIRRLVGADAFARGRVYATSGRVVDLRIDDDEGVVVASVWGRIAQPYQTVVTISRRANSFGATVSGSCTCPMSIDCKHVAAVLIAARGNVAVLSPARAPAPAWERRLQAVVAAQEQGIRTSLEPLGLQFELIPQGRPSRASSWVPVKPPRIRLRPVVRGRKGGWVRTGVSWRDVRRGAAGRWVPAQQLALRDIYAAHDSSDGYYYYSSESPVCLDDFGPSIWPLLSRAADAGVCFVASKQSDGPVRLAASPGAVALDARRSGRSKALALRGVVELEDLTLVPGSAALLGRPPHGLAVHTSLCGPDVPAGLLLAPLAGPLTEEVAALVSAAGTLDVPAADVERFLRDYYPKLRRAVAVHSGDASVELPEIQPPRPLLTVTHLPQHRVELTWSFTYRCGDAVTRFPLAGEPTPVRDLGAEQRALASLNLAPERWPQLWATDGELQLAPAVRLAGLDAVQFVTELLPSLLDHVDVDVDVIGEAAPYRHSESAPLVQISATDASDSADWFDLAVKVSIDGEEIGFQELFAALARSESHLILDSGTFFSIERPEYDQLRRLIEEARQLQDRESDGLRVTRYQAAWWAELARLGVVEEQSRRWAATVDGLVDLRRIEQPSKPAGLHAELRPYQGDGFAWLNFLRDHGLGGILADDMGLGKTVQALALMCRAFEADPLADPFLVVAPTSVVHNWQLEAERFAPDLEVVCVTETQARAAIGLRERVKGAHVVVTSYALFRIEFDSYAELDWSGLMLDEAQYVKNHQAKTYQCVRRLKAPFKLAMTGTPLENSLMDLWSLLSIVAPGLFPNPQRFTEHYRKPIEKGTDPELLATLRRRIRPLMLRRTKDQVASDLPPKQEQVLEVTLHPRHAKIYQTHLQRERQKVLGLIGDLDKNRFTIFRSLTLLRQLSLAPGLVDEKYAGVPSSKVDAFLEQISEVVEGGHRALVFSQFTSFLRLVRERLRSEGIDTCYLDGRTRKRAEQIDAFKNGNAPVFLISLKAGGFGLNLTEADYCFVLDPWWNPAAEAQAVDRTHRIGQDKTVMVYRLVAADTIEEKVMELKARKQDLFNKVVDEDALMSAPLTADDVRGLFGI